MISELFIKWIEHFIQHVNASPTNKVVLILNCHSKQKTIEAHELKIKYSLTMSTPSLHT